MQTREQYRLTSIALRRAAAFGLVAVLSTGADGATGGCDPAPVDEPEPELVLHCDRTTTHTIDFGTTEEIVLDRECVESLHKDGFDTAEALIEAWSELVVLPSSAPDWLDAGDGATAAPARRGLRIRSREEGVALPNRGETELVRFTLFHHDNVGEGSIDWSTELGVIEVTVIVGDMPSIDGEPAPEVDPPQGPIGCGLTAADPIRLQLIDGCAVLMNPRDCAQRALRYRGESLTRVAGPDWLEVGECFRDDRGYDGIRLSSSERYTLGQHSLEIARVESDGAKEVARFFVEVDVPLTPAAWTASLELSGVRDGDSVPAEVLSVRPLILPPTESIELTLTPTVEGPEGISSQDITVTWTVRPYDQTCGAEVSDLTSVQLGGRRLTQNVDFVWDGTIAVSQPMPLAAAQLVQMKLTGAGCFILEAELTHASATKTVVTSVRVADVPIIWIDAEDRGDDIVFTAVDFWVPLRLESIPRTYRWRPRLRGHERLHCANAPDALSCSLPRQDGEVKTSLTVSFAVDSRTTVDATAEAEL